MLIIRREQMEALDAACLRQFQNREIARLRARFPEKTQELDDQEIRQVITTAIESAKKYKVTDEVDVGRYLDFMFRYDYEFDTNTDTSWAHEILMDENLNGTGKMNALEEYELFELVLPRL